MARRINMKPFYHKTIVGLCFLTGIAVLVYWFVIPHIVEQRRQTIRRARAKILNLYKPSMRSLVDLLEKDDRKYAGTAAQYVPYYKKLVEVLPQLAEGYVMLGWCYAQLGQTNDAIGVFQTAIDRNPYYFWSYYNLGLLYAQEEQYPQAIQVLQRAIELPPNTTIKMIESAKVFREVWMLSSRLHKQTPQRLQKGYGVIARLMKNLKRRISPSRRQSKLNVDQLNFYPF